MCKLTPPPRFALFTLNTNVYKQYELAIMTAGAKFNRMTNKCLIKNTIKHMPVKYEKQ